MGRSNVLWLGVGIVGILALVRYKPQWAGATAIILGLYYAGRAGRMEQI